MGAVSVLSLSTHLTSGCSPTLPQLLPAPRRFLSAVEKISRPTSKKLIIEANLKVLCVYLQGLPHRKFIFYLIKLYQFFLYVCWWWISKLFRSTMLWNLMILFAASQWVHFLFPKMPSEGVFRLVGGFLFKVKKRSIWDSKEGYWKDF
jgi:hypothetical protein